MTRREQEAMKLDSAALEILVVEDDSTARVIIEEALLPLKCMVQSVALGLDGLKAAENDDFDVVLLDLGLPDIDGLDALRRFREHSESPEVVVVTGDERAETAVDAMSQGAFHYLVKPIDAERLRVVVGNAGERSRLRRENQLLRIATDHQHYVGRIVSESAEMKTVLATVARIAPSDVPVLISGETGVGKGLIAKVIHGASGRSKANFVHVNCATVPKGLAESELFGHRKGAFTGAADTRPGLFEAANRGTLFLDEISELDWSMQAKLLVVLDSGQFRRVGGSRDRRTTARLVAATNRDVRNEVENGEFREDLYFRLSVVGIRIPPLRERKDDIDGLVSLYLARFGGQTRRLSPKARELLRNYSWPGNARQLANQIQSALLMSNQETLVPADFQLSAPRPVAGRTRREDGRPLTLKEFELDYILQILEQTAGNKTAAARLLGIDVKTLRSKIRASKERA